MYLIPFFGRAMELFSVFCQPGVKYPALKGTNALSIVNSKNLCLPNLKSNCDSLIFLKLNVLILEIITEYSELKTAIKNCRSKN